MNVSPRPHPLVAAATALVVAAGLTALGQANGAFDLVPRQTAGIVLWWCVGLGALVFLRPPRPASIPSALTVSFSLAMAGWIALHVSGSISVERSANELARAITHVAPLLLVGWVLPRNLWRSVVVGVALAGVALTAMAFAHRLSPDFLASRDFILFSNYTQRLSIPMGYWNAVGICGALTLILLLAIGSHAASSIARAAALAAAPLCIATVYCTYSRSPLGAAAVGAVVLFAASRNRATLLITTAATALAGLVVISAVRGHDEIALGTGTAGRGAVLTAVVLSGLVLAGVAVAAHRIGADRLRMSRRPALVVAALTVLVAGAAGVVAIDRYGQKAWDSFKTPERTTKYADPTERLNNLNTTRVKQWEAALDAWRERRATGYGAGTFELVYNQRQTFPEFVRDAHNTYVETLAEQGTLGLLLLLGFLGSAGAAILVAIRRAADDLERGLLAGIAGVFAAWVLGTGVDWFWEVTGLAMLVLALIGAALAASGRPESATADASHALDGPAAAPPTPASRASRLPGWLPRTAIALLALVAVLVELPGLVGMSEIRRSGRDVQAGDLAKARDHADRAIDVLPWASSPFLQRALVDEEAGQWQPALRAITLAERRDPQDWRLPLVRARIEAKAGNPREALAAFRRAKELRPLGNFFR